MHATPDSIKILSLISSLARRTSRWLLVFLALAASAAVAAEISFDQRLIRLGDQIIKVEIADNPDRQKKGLTNRDTLGKHEGMLFVFPATGARTFWMKDTRIPLSLGAFDRNRKLLVIKKLAPYDSTQFTGAPIVTTPPQTRYTLEVRQGWFENHRIEPGARFNFLSQ